MVLITGEGKKAQQKYVTSIAQVANSESMPERMWRTPYAFNTGPLRVFFDYRSETVGS